MCMGATDMVTGQRVTAGQALSSIAKSGGAAAPMAAPELPPLPAMPQLPTMAPPPAVTARSIIAGPTASTAAPTAQQGGRAGRRRRGSPSSAGLSIGSTQSSPGTGLNIGR